MQTVLITLVGPTRRVDLKLPAEVAIGDLLPKLLEICGTPSALSQEVHPQWCLVRPISRLVLPFNRSLYDSGVVDGTVLWLQDSASFIAQQQAATQNFRSQSGISTGGIGYE